MNRNDEIFLLLVHLKLSKTVNQNHFKQLFPYFPFINKSTYKNHLFSISIGTITRPHDSQGLLHQDYLLSVLE
uniref:Uncharacterized protein n=1 Tax=Manihot esculenta TaxID=3983 RepID=A0A2C9URW1_MANES